MKEWLSGGNNYNRSLPETRLLLIFKALKYHLTLWNHQVSS